MSGDGVLAEVIKTFRIILQAFVGIFRALFIGVIFALYNSTLLKMKIYIFHDISLL